MEPETIDALGLLCPLPVLLLRKRLALRPAGTVVQLWADDPAARIDVPHFCAEAGHCLIETTDGPRGHVFVVRSGAAPPGTIGAGGGAAQGASG